MLYTEIARFDRDGLQVIVDWRDEDRDPWDELSECFDSEEQFRADMDAGVYYWFILRVRVMLRNHELACKHLGGCLYQDPTQVLTDGTVDDQLLIALPEARQELQRLHDDAVALNS